MSEDISIEGRSAWFACPSHPSGAVVVCHGGSGLAPHERKVVERLAALGFAAVAPDLFGERPTDRGAWVAMIGGLVSEPSRLRARVAAAVERMREFGRVGVVGHCFGGTAALEAARAGLDIACAVSLHGGLKSPRPAERIDARVLACCGAADPFCPAEQRAAFEAEMSASAARWDLHVYGGVRHGFSVRGSDKSAGCAYDERADRASWTAMIALLEETVRA